MEYHNKIRKSDLALEKYWLTQSGYPRLTNTVAFSIFITNGKLLYCHGVSEENVDKKLSVLDCNNRTVYDCFNILFTTDFGSLSFHLPPVTIHDISRLHKRA